jgi:hypothetical protein
MISVDKTRIILKRLHNNIIHKKPFSLIRFGDGGLKMMNAINRLNENDIGIISEKEGIPFESMKSIMDLWVKYANLSDYIDTPVVYDKVNFWGRYKNKTVPINKGTQQLLYDWEIIYNKVGITTKNRLFCNPEFNWLAILNSDYNLFDVMKNRKICFISIYDNLPRLSEFNITYHKIVGHYENQFEYSFADTIKYIESHIDDYDLWLNSSGELGRVYSGRIRELGGCVLDMGFVAQYWNNSERPLRFNKFMVPDVEKSYCMKLTSDGQMFKEAI